MNVVGVLVSTIKEGAADALEAGPGTSVGTPSGPASTDTTPPIVEHPTADSSEAQVLALLEANDGRMYQQDVIAETGYSAGTVSRVLSELEDDGRIARLRKGRKKIVVDPDLLPSALTEA